MNEALDRYDLKNVLRLLEKSQAHRMAGELEPAIAQLTFAVAKLLDCIRADARGDYPIRG